MEIDSMARELGSLVVGLEHFGSTSVPGCDAKPVIDILVGVREWLPPAAVVRTLEQLGMWTSEKRGSVVACICAAAGSAART
jgi:GrpB-like predicted nucleotidyltransferase (UPF0157 family)